MNRFVFMLAVMLFLMTSVVKANPVDINIAKAIGAKFMKTDNLQFVKSYKLKNGDAAFYIFNTANGFVIVSADNCVTPILAYSNEGRFEEDKIPIQVQSHLDDFVEQIQYGVDNNFVADKVTAHQWELVGTTGFVNEQNRDLSVAPLISSKWSQNEPYNIFCPEMANEYGNHALAGSSAVAMGQVMRYWGYPQTGQGSHGGIDFGNAAYNWNDMPNEISIHSDSAAIASVATLLWHCGVSLDVEYDAEFFNPAIGTIVCALTTYFKYSPEMELEFKNDYTDEEWISKLKANLDLGRPLIVSGSSNDETNTAHIFICDGYDANDLLHLNWGWGGNLDGYYRLGVFNIPPDLSFNTDNCAIFNIHPDDPSQIEEIFDTSEVVSYEVFDVLGRRADNNYENHVPGAYFIRYTMKSGNFITKKVAFKR